MLLAKGHLHTDVYTFNNENYKYKDKLKKKWDDFHEDSKAANIKATSKKYSRQETDKFWKSAFNTKRDGSKTKFMVWKPKNENLLVEPLLWDWLIGLYSK